MRSSLLWRRVQNLRDTINYEAKRITQVKRINAHRSQLRRPFSSNQLHTSSVKARTIFSGIQPTGIPHLGNYLGAIQPWVSLQNDAALEDTLIFSVVDLHSLSSRTQTPTERRIAKRQTLAILLAAGLNPTRCTLFYQSSVPEHAELHWILSCEAGMGWLARMPTWREKLGTETSSTGHEVDIAALLAPGSNPRSQERLKLGLFSYPVLQAADILLYGTTHVPVGADQLVHVEFARAAATAFNATYGSGGTIDAATGKKRKGTEILKPPEPMVARARRVMSLVSPQKKMSKSEVNEHGRILLTDEEDIVRKKLRGAVTDSLDQTGEGVTFDPERRPGVSNLLEIIAHITEVGGCECSPQDVAKEFQGLQVQGSVLRVLKERAAELVIAHLSPVRDKYNQLIGESDGKAIDDVADQGRKRAQGMARQQLDLVRDFVGLRN